MTRQNKRKPNELRPIQFVRNFTRYAEGSVLACFGETKVICTASIVKGVPKFLKDTGQGWLTAEYSMLPRATHDRTDREAVKGKQSGRTIEIQRLIGRSLRAAVDLKKLGEFTIALDCDVIQADGGTRTTAISGSCVALIDALRTLQRRKELKTDPLISFVAAVSVGVHKNKPILDLDYTEDSEAEIDMNLVMNENGELIEIQGTGERGVIQPQQLVELLELGKHGIAQIIAAQKEILE